eukprot:jgi/Chlat1/675/Chrsp104S01149
MSPASSMMAAMALEGAAGGAATDELDRLESQFVEGDFAGGGAASSPEWQAQCRYLELVRQRRLRRSENVARVGAALLKAPGAAKRLGDKAWTLIEQVCLAAIDVHDMDLAKDALEGLESKFSEESRRVARLRAMYVEATGDLEEANRIYDEMLEENPVDQHVLKRKVAMAKSHGPPAVAVDAVLKYLDVYSTDIDGWRELADMYTNLQMYKQAAFCYEELMLHLPQHWAFHRKYAEVLYTWGGVENFRLARKYYASAVELSSGTDIRALYGLTLTASQLASIKGAKPGEENAELQRLSSSALVKLYKFRAPSKEQLVSTVLNLQAKR